MYKQKRGRLKFIIYHQATMTYIIVNRGKIYIEFFRDNYI